MRLTFNLLFMNVVLIYLFLPLIYFAQTIEIHPLLNSLPDLFWYTVVPYSIWVIVSGLYLFGMMKTRDSQLVIKLGIDKNKENPVIGYIFMFVYMLSAIITCYISQSFLDLLVPTLIICVMLISTLYSHILQKRIYDIEHILKQQERDNYDQG